MLGEDTVEEDRVLGVEVNNEVVMVIKVLDVIGVDEVLLEGETVWNGITPTEERSDWVRGLLVVFW